MQASGASAFHQANQVREELDAFQLVLDSIMGSMINSAEMSRG